MKTVFDGISYFRAKTYKLQLRAAGIHACIFGTKASGYGVMVPACDMARINAPDFDPKAEAEKLRCT